VVRCIKASPIELSLLDQLKPVSPNKTISDLKLLADLIVSAEQKTRRETNNEVPTETF
jgi:hypothetical protein